MLSCGVHLSVCLSVTFVYSVETCKHIPNFFTVRVFSVFSCINLHKFSFPYQALWQYSDRDHPPNTHSLTAALDQLRVVASSTSNDPGPRSRQHQQIDRPMSSSNCCSQFLRGRPGGRFQSAAGGVPVWASIDS